MPTEVRGLDNFPLGISRFVEWITVNPGRQLVSGSFDPLFFDWFADALVDTKGNEEGGNKKRQKLKFAVSSSKVLCLCVFCDFLYYPISHLFAFVSITIAITTGIGYHGQ